MPASTPRATAFTRSLATPGNASPTITGSYPPRRARASGRGAGLRAFHRPNEKARPRRAETGQHQSSPRPVRISPPRRQGRQKYLRRSAAVIRLLPAVSRGWFRAVPLSPTRATLWMARCPLVSRSLTALGSHLGAHASPSSRLWTLMASPLVVRWTRRRRAAPEVRMLTCCVRS